MPTPTSVEIAAWLACLVAVVAGANQVLRLLDRLKEQPPPTLTYVSKADCLRLHKDQDDRLKRLEDAFITVLTRTEFETFRNQVRGDMQRLHDRIDIMPEKIVTILKNTGAID